MPTKYVMANLPDGTSDVVSRLDITDIPRPHPSFGGLDLWLNAETPVDLAGDGDPVAGKPMIHEPPVGGAVFRVLVIDPTKGQLSPSTDEMLAAHATLKSVNVPTAGYLAKAKDPTMHRTDTLNYFVIVSGQLWALSDREDVLLGPGDVLIQKGCMHGWRAHGTVPAVMVGVLISAKPPPPAAEKR